jgi:prepilin-type processing-associated H-X9-DG protein
VNYFAPAWNQPAKSQADIRKAAEISIIFGGRRGNAFMFDHPCGPAWPADPNAGDPHTRIEGSPFSPEARTRQGHLEGGNFTYADGHAKWLTSSKIGEQIAITQGKRGCLGAGVPVLPLPPNPYTSLLQEF